jgi:L-lysine 6-transaminase
MVLDLERSHGSWLHDAPGTSSTSTSSRASRRGRSATTTPACANRKFLADITQAALNNPSNSDLYTTQMAEFVEAFATKVTPKGFPYHFWISGGALAVENALKVAFDWKAHKIGLDKLENDGAGLVVLHFRQAFHGRSGYTMSLTNTDTRKIALFPKFDWPRVTNPAIEYDLDGNVANDVAAL